MGTSGSCAGRSYLWKEQMSINKKVTVIGTIVILGMSAIIGVTYVRRSEKKQQPEEVFAQVQPYEQDGDAYAYLQTPEGYVYLHAVNPVQEKDGVIHATAAEVLSVGEDKEPVLCGYIETDPEYDVIRSNGEYFYTVSGNSITKYHLDGKVFDIAEEFTISRAQDGTETYEYIKDGMLGEASSNERFVELMDEYKTLPEVVFQKIGEGELAAFSDWHTKIPSVDQ